jgi:dipeptidase E
MRLYLCSYRIQLPDALADLLGKPLSGARVAVIPNAKDYYAERARAFKIGQMYEHLQELGLKPETVDLHDYHDGKKLLDTLKTFDIVWVAGGNTYCLRYEMQRSGFDQIVHELLGHVVYAGESAGALVMGTSLAGIEAADIPEFSERVIQDGLGVIPKFILPHADSEYFAEANAEARRIHAAKDILSINDNQAYVVNGRSGRLVTALVMD